ncbi:TetR family transcriptional regulator C-terminal domain-containing protein [Nocardioides sp. GY 10127]|uniref:TetR/AcrR family transcriptional regulator n=1 Tax=Nocardioides sp. GY 10127 TaxID=2569762 RepID=UPI001458F42D|nr:TetR family transcriptional regulator C-terminal domain-containing protein [Nocardioides sp. GY 10127]
MSPKEIRQTTIADAALRIIARSGVPAVTIREVAREAGCSVGAVQHSVGSRSDLMTLAWHRASVLAIDEIERVAAEIDDPVQRVVGPLVLMLPIDEPEVALTRVFMAFYGVFDDETGDNPEAAAYSRWWRETTAGMIRAGQEAGAVPGHRSADDLAFDLTAYVEGLCVFATLDPAVRAGLDRDRVAAQLRAMLLA